MSEVKLPLGAVATADGQVVVPASRRADGSTRKPIRIRQGYVPQDEVPKYKTVAQRRREQEAKRAAEERKGGDDGADSAVDELAMASLSLKPQKESPRSQARPQSGEVSSSRQEGGRRQPERDSTKAAEPADQQQHLKTQLTKINKQLKEIAKLEGDDKELTAQQKQKTARKQELQQQRNEIIGELNGATVTKSASSASGLRPKVAISL